MAASPRRVYWDACTWIALIHKEQEREILCRAVIESARKGRIEILTSTFSLAEVCKDPGIKSQGPDAIADYFENDYILLVNVDRQIGLKARELMTSGFAGLKPPDATHLASAALSGVEEMHTFDQRLLNINGKIVKKDGTKLKICKPDVGGPPTPLLETLNEPPNEQG